MSLFRASVSWSSTGPPITGAVIGRAAVGVEAGRPGSVRLHRELTVLRTDKPFHRSWLDPAYQALGAAPTTRTGTRGVDALLWIKRPGESDGKCGGEVSYFFSPRQARELIVNSPDVPPDARHSAQLASAPPATTSPMG